MNTKTSSSVILVPGHWLGGWAWDDVAELLSRAGQSPVAVTLTGLDAPETRRDAIRLADHVGSLVAAIRSSASPVVLVAHSGAGALATAALDQVPGMVRRVVYVDSGPVADGAVARPDLDPSTVEVPLPTWEQLEAGGASLTGLSEGMLRRFRARAVPHPAGPLREPITARDPARNQVPATIVCCSIPSAAVRPMAASGAGMFAPLADLADVGYVDLPTGHWPMWSAPRTLAEVIMDAADD
ncbi:MAG: alpha/beta hydrolase [Actinomycetia bacterium]|nr:alpha/beta hydrolase [Actinomycetes bacterium]